MLRRREESILGLRSGSAPSSDIRDRARLSDGLLQPSRIASAKSFFRLDPARCDNVDLRRLKGRRCGELAAGEFQEKMGVASFSVSFSSAESAGSFCAESNA